MQKRRNLWANTLTALTSGVSLSVPLTNAVSDNAYLKKLENVKKSLRRGLEGPVQAIGHVHHDVDCTLETVVRCVHSLDVGAAQSP